MHFYSTQDVRLFPRQQSVFNKDDLQQKLPFNIDCLTRTASGQLCEGEGNFIVKG